jgi:GAF domain-containing protein
MARDQVMRRSQLAVPLLRAGEPIGVVSMMRIEVRPFLEREIVLLEEEVPPTN